MLKNVFFLLALSLLGILFIKEVVLGLHYVSLYHHYAARLLSDIFTGDHLGRVIRETLALFIIPFLVGAIPGLIYWLVMHKIMPYMYHVMWLIWVMLLTSIALH